MCSRRVAEARNVWVEEGRKAVEKLSKSELGLGCSGGLWLWLGRGGPTMWAALWSWFKTEEASSWKRKSGMHYGIYS